MASPVLNCANETGNIHYNNSANREVSAVYGALGQFENGNDGWRCTFGWGDAVVVSKCSAVLFLQNQQANESGSTIATPGHRSVGA